MYNHVVEMERVNTLEGPSPMEMGSETIQLRGWLAEEPGCLPDRLRRTAWENSSRGGVGGKEICPEVRE